MDATIQIPEFSLSSTQIGKIAESLVAAQLMMASNGRLSPFAPLADDDGTDLVVVDKLTGLQSRIQVKCRQASRNAPPGTVQFDVRKKTFSATRDNYLLYVLLDPDPGLLWRAWLIPAVDLQNVAMDKNNKFVITPNPSPSSTDKYSSYRCADLGEVATLLASGAG